MAGKTQKLQTDIVLGGQVDESFNHAIAVVENQLSTFVKTFDEQLDIKDDIYIDLDKIFKKIKSGLNDVSEWLVGAGDQLEAMGNVTKEISDKIFELSKESLNVYQEYEDGILELKSVWQDSYDSAYQLNAAMTSIEEKAQEWASTSIFHTDDIANALAEAAHAGWDYEEMLEGIPAAMLLAQAGDMELTEAVDYMAKTLASTGTAFEDSEDFLNSWAKAANLTSTDISEMGLALRNLGSTAQLAESTDEVFTFLSALASVGTVSATAGTHLRAVFLRLVAPTKSAAEAMDMLDLSEEELDEAFEDITDESNEAYQQLEGLGFSAYDEQGNLKSFIELFEDLDKALNQLATDEERNEILATLFPQRTFSDAMTFLNMVRSGEMQELYSEISGVDEGYMEDIAETRMSGLTGATEIFLSKWEELERKAGEYLAPFVEEIYDFAGGILDYFNNMDEDKFQAILAGLESFATVAPTLLIAGKALKYIGSLFTPVGLFGTGLAVLAGITGYVLQLQESDMADNFGDMALDMEAISGYIDEIGSGYETMFAEAHEFSTYLDECVEDYQAASGELSSGLMTAMLTGDELTPDEMKQFESLGKQMADAVYNGIGNAKASDISYWEALLGEFDYDESLGVVTAIDGSALDSYLKEAEGISESFKNALYSAFEDGVVSDEEYETLKCYMDAYNEALTKAAYESEQQQNYIDREKMLAKAQTASYDEYEEIIAEVEEKNQDVYDEAYDEYLEKKSRLKYDWENGNTAGYTQAEFDAAIQDIDAAWAQESMALKTEADVFLGNVASSFVQGSELGEMYSSLEDYAGEVLAGTMSMDQAMQNMEDNYGLSLYAGDRTWNLHDAVNGTQRDQMTEYLADVVSAYGGLDSIEEKIDYYMQQEAEYTREGNQEEAEEARAMATELQTLYLMQGINNKNSIVQTGSDNLDVSIPIFNVFKSQFGANESRTNTNVTKWQKTNATNMTAAGIVFDANIELNDLTKDTKAEAQLAQKYLDTNPGEWMVIPYLIKDAEDLVAEHSSTQTGTTQDFGLGMYAEGGRATTASIFGEDGAEWAIPETHTANTASLLAQAAAASGFTWQDIASVSGNGGGTLVYSPTIYAQNAEGVAQKLQEDKERLEKWWKNRAMREDIAVYA